MKFLLTTLFFCTLANLTMGQTIVQSMQTTNNDKVLRMNVVGTKDGRPFQHTLQFDVLGMTQLQRDSLYQATVQALDILGIKRVPGLTKQATDTTSNQNLVTFTCGTCAEKGRLEVYGNGITSTRIIDSRQDGNHSFPLKIALGPGDYRLVYYQKRVLQIQSTFTVKAGKENVVSVK